MIKMTSVYRWMLRKVKGTNKSRTKKMIEIMALENKKPEWIIKLDLYKNVLTRGVGYTDYFRGNYFNLSKKEKDTFVTTKSFYRLLSYLNDEKYEVVLNDKLIFNKVFEEYLKRDYLNLRTASEEDFQRFLKGKTSFFAKDPTGYGGHGVEKILIKDYPSWQKLFQTLKEKKQFLVEEEIKQCKAINELNPHVVSSFRIVTLYKDGKAYIIGNALRINQDATNVIGCTNDLYFRLNEEGKIDSHVIDDYGTVYETHPLSGKRFDEVVVPGVKEAFLMCQEAALRIPQIRYIGWDIAFTEKGPVMVEGNEYPGYGILQFYKLNDKKTGHLKDISDVLKGEMKKIKL